MSAFGASSVFSGASVFLSAGSSSSEQASAGQVSGGFARSTPTNHGNNGFVPGFGSEINASGSRGRGGRGRATFGNRSLVVNNPTSSASSIPTQSNANARLQRTFTPQHLAQAQVQQGDTDMGTVHSYAHYADAVDTPSPPRFSTSSATPANSATDREKRFSMAPKNNKYQQMKLERDALKQKYIKDGKMYADDAKVDLSDAFNMVGECEDMCPEFERHEREFQNTLHPYEKLDGVDGVDHKRAVKRYRRSASDGFAVLPCDIRPPRVLIKTLDYLFHEIIPTKGLEDSHDFVRDRTRGIRNDFTLQNYREYEAVECHERIARYHIICASKLMDTENFSLQQEQEQMRKTLQSLREYYIDMNKRGIPCPNEAEFQAYYILSHFWQNEIVTMAETLPAHVYDDARVQRAIELQQLAQCATAPVFKGMRRALGGLAFSSRLFRVLGDVGTPYLVAALVHQEFVRIRCNVLRTMNRALYDFAPHVDVGELVGLLGCDDEEEVLNILDYYEIKVEEGMDGRLVAFVGKDVDGNKVKAKFFNEFKRVSLAPRSSRRLVDSKIAGVDIRDIIDGVDVGPAKPIPPPPGYVARPVSSSITPSTFASPVIIQKSKFPNSGSSSTLQSPGMNQQLAHSTGQPSAAAAEPIFGGSSIFSQQTLVSEKPAVAAKSTFGSSSIFKRQNFSTSSTNSFGTPGTFNFLSSSSSSVNSQESSRSINVASVEASKPLISWNLPGASTALLQGSSLQSSIKRKSSEDGGSSSASNGVIKRKSFTDASTSSTSNGRLGVTSEFSPPASVGGFFSSITAPVQASLPNFTGLGDSLSKSTPGVPAQTVLDQTLSATAPSRQSTSRQPVLIAKEPSTTWASLDMPVVEPSRPTPAHPTSQGPTRQELYTLDTLIEDEIAVAVKQCLNEDLLLVRPLTDLLLEETLLEELEYVAGELVQGILDAEEDAVRADLARLRKSAFVRWFREAKKRAVKREEAKIARQNRAVRFYKEILAGPALGKVRRRQWSYGGGEADYLKQEPQVDFNYLDIPALILKPLNGKAQTRNYPRGHKLGQLQWKLVVSTPAFHVPAGGAASVHSMNRISSLWTCSKFGAGGDGSETSKLKKPKRFQDEEGEEADTWDRIERDSGYRVDELLRLSVDLPEGGEKVMSRNSKTVRLSVNVAHVHVMREAVYPLKDNFEAVSSGAQAVLFQLGWFDRKVHEDLSAWWENERDRLYSLLSTLPRGSRVPLVLLFFPSPSMSGDNFSKSVSEQLNLDSVLTENGGPISAIDFRLINGGNLNDVEAVDALKGCVEWLADMSDGIPIVRSDIVKDFIESHAADSVRTAFSQIERMVPDADFAFDIKAHAATFNCLIDVYNAQVDSLTRLLTSPEASLIAFPSRELANSYPQNPPIVWNAPKILATVREALERVKLPHIRIQDPSENDVGPGFGAVKRMYQEYVGSLAAAGFVGDGGALLSLVWSRIAGFERSVMIAGRMGTIKPGTSPSFPFGKVGLGFAGSAVEVLKSVLKQLANRIGGGGESPWYDWGQIQEAVYEFDDKIESTVVRWEKEVRTPWVRLGVTKTPAATGLKLPGGMQAFTTPSRNGKLAAVSKSPASPSLRYGTPLSQVIEHELSNTSATPISSMVQSSWSTPASAIKRRMMETLALCKLEAEKTKRLTK